MPMFAVTYTHPNEAEWRQHLMAHIDYLRALLKTGELRASGPLNGTAVRSAMLIMSAENREALMATIAKDPFAIEGLIEDMTVTEWDPIFGAFTAESSRPGF